MSAEPPPPPQVSPDTTFDWVSQRWVPMQGPVAQEPPVPGQRSPDGNYYWDAERWLPMALAPEAGISPRRKGHALRNVSLGCLGLIVLLVIIGIAANGANFELSNCGTWTKIG